MKKKRSGAVGVLSISKSGEGVIDIAPTQNTILPLKDGKEVKIVINR